MKISAVLPTYNNEDTIEKCLTSILNQTKKFDEIIVIDDGSEDGTGKIVEKYPVKLIKIKHGGRPVARNVGWRASAGDIVAFIEADSYYDSRWIEEMMKKIDSGDIINDRIYAWGGKGILADVFKKMLDRRWEIIKNNPLGGWVFKREVLESLNGFDESLPRGQDVDLFKRAKEKGHKIVATGAAKMYHKGSVPPGFRDFAKWSANHGSGMFNFYLKYPDEIPKKIIFFIILPLTLIKPLFFLILLVSFILFTCFRGIIFFQLRGKEVVYYPIISLVENYSFLYGLIKTLISEHLK